MISQARSSVSAIALTLALFFGCSGVTNAACYAPDQQLPAQTVSDFLNNSDNILQDPKNAQGGADMITLVRDLVASNPTTLPLVIALLPKANKDQQTAIGNALGQAADKLCKTTDPVYAADIQSRLAASGAQAAMSEYAAVTGNAPIRSVAAGGGVSGGSSGGSTGGSLGSTIPTSNFTQFSSTSTSNSPGNFFSGGASSASAGSSSTTLGSTAATSVSP